MSRMSVEEYKERIGRLMLYRNRIIEKVIREAEKDFPDMNILSEELARLVEAVDEYDEVIVSILSEIGDREPTETVEEDAERQKEVIPFNEWFISVLNSINGNDTMKDYLKLLKEKGGVALSGKLLSDLNIKRNWGSTIEKELEEAKIIKSHKVGSSKIVYFNHPEYSGLSAEQMLKMIE
jgi:hypothetical protein